MFVDSGISSFRNHLAIKYLSDQVLPCGTIQHWKMKDLNCLAQKLHKYHIYCGYCCLISEILRTDIKISNFLFYFSVTPQWMSSKRKQKYYLKLLDEL